MIGMGSRPRAILALYCLGATAMFSSGLVLRVVLIAGTRLFHPAFYAFAPDLAHHISDTNLILLPAGALLVFGITRFRDVRLQRRTYLALWAYAAVMYIAWFGHWSHLSQAAWIWFFASCLVATMLIANVVLMPYWFGRISGVTPSVAYSFVAFACLGIAFGQPVYARLLFSPPGVPGNVLMLQFGVLLAFILTGLFMYYFKASATELPRNVAYEAPSVGYYLLWILLSFAPNALGEAILRFTDAAHSPVPIIWFVSSFFLLALSLAFVQKRSEKRDDRTETLGRWARASTYVLTAVFFLNMAFVLQEVARPIALVLQESALPLAVLPFLLLALSALPYVVTLPLQIGLFIPALLLFFGFVPVPMLWMLSLVLVVYWVSARGCFGRLVELGPVADYLPHYFVCISVGQILAALHCAFSTHVIALSPTVEYPLALLMCCAVRFLPRPTAVRKDGG